MSDSNAELRKYRCPICMAAAYGQEEREEHASEHPGMKASAMRWV